MISSEDEKWLNDAYPRLKLNGNQISGVIEFTATYNKDKNRFLVLKEGVTDDVGGLRLDGGFSITITERVQTPYSKLPAVHVKDIEPIPNRHFNQSDASACLGSPLEETDFLLPVFKFQKFLEELVIPFLYGQVYYTAHKTWPWFDYQHGGIGLLQSFSKIQRIPDESLVQELLSYLKQDAQWPLFKDILILPRPSKRTCPCGSREKLRDCHLEIMEGITRLKASINEFNLRIDQM